MLQLSYNTLVHTFAQTNHTSAGAMYAGSSVASCERGNAVLVMVTIPSSQDWAEFASLPQTGR